MTETETKIKGVFTLVMFGSMKTNSGVIAL